MAEPIHCVRDMEKEFKSRYMMFDLNDLNLNSSNLILFFVCVCVRIVYICFGEQMVNGAKTAISVASSTFAINPFHKIHIVFHFHFNYEP